MPRPTVDYSLYYVTGRALLPTPPPAAADNASAPGSTAHDGEYYLEHLEHALKGGVTVVQIREKDVDGGDFFVIARRSKEVCDRVSSPLPRSDSDCKSSLLPPSTKVQRPAVHQRPARHCPPPFLPPPCRPIRPSVPTRAPTPRSRPPPRRQCQHSRGDARDPEPGAEGHGRLCRDRTVFRNADEEELESDCRPKRRPGRPAGPRRQRDQGCCHRCVSRFCSWVGDFSGLTLS